MNFIYFGLRPFLPVMQIRLNVVLSNVQRENIFYLTTELMWHCLTVLRVLHCWWAYIDSYRKVVKRKVCISSFDTLCMFGVRGVLWRALENLHAVSPLSSSFTASHNYRKAFYNDTSKYRVQNAVCDVYWITASVALNDSMNISRTK